MALVTMGALVTDLKGSIGGSTFQHTGAGLIVRNKPIGRKSGTHSQSVIRQFPNTYTQAWRNLTMAQKLAWAAFAAVNLKKNRYGESKTISGFAWFESINYNFTRIGAVNVLIPPIYTAPPAVDVFTVLMTSTKIQYSWLLAPAPANTRMLYWATYFISGVSQKNRSVYRYIQTTVPGGFTTLNIAANWTVVFGDPFAGRSVGTKVNLMLGMEYVDSRSGVTGPTLYANGEFTF